MVKSTTHMAGQSFCGRMNQKREQISGVSAYVVAHSPAPRCDVARYWCGERGHLSRLRPSLPAHQIWERLAPFGHGENRSRWSLDGGSLGIGLDPSLWVVLGCLVGRRGEARPAVGDTCLFHTRGAELLNAFPVDHSEQFDSRPLLVGSRTPPEMVEEDRAVSAQGDAESSDSLWMMTDALAQWFLTEHEDGNQPWTEFESVMATPNAEEQFAEWIKGLRNSKRLRNDDVTLLAVGL